MDFAFVILYLNNEYIPKAVNFDPCLQKVPIYKPEYLA